MTNDCRWHAYCYRKQRTLPEKSGKGWKFRGGLVSHHSLEDYMKASKRKQSLISVVVLGLLLMLAMPGTAFGQNRNRGHRGQNRDWSKHQRKCGKFVNCHDARDGRVDGRGPNRFRRNSRWRNRDRNNWALRNRNRRIIDTNGRSVLVRRNLR